MLLVDDDGTTNFINHRLIKKLNIADEIQSAVNGDKAMQFITQFAFQHQNHSPELILLDLNMPGADGFDFLKAFMEIPFANRDQVKLIILTTSSHKRDLDIVREEKLGYINKPLTDQKLMDVLASCGPLL
ncbi:MAG: response regulator [Cytophagaceae bacterium]